MSPSKSPRAVPHRQLSVAGLLLCTLFIVSVQFSVSRGSYGDPTNLLDLTPTAPVEVYAYLPFIARPYQCPRASDNEYEEGIAYQRDFDNPVRLANRHADKNIELRGYTANTDANVPRGLVDYGSDDDTQPPQLATLFDPPRVPLLVHMYRVHHWEWAPSPEPGSRSGPILDYPVTALGMRTVPGERLHVPQSGYDIGGHPPMEVLVLFADADTVALRYTRDDSSARPGYTLHIDNLCTDPSLLTLYNELDDANGTSVRLQAASRASLWVSAP
jgi:hypothetical protein